VGILMKYSERGGGGGGWNNMAMAYFTGHVPGLGGA